MDRRLRHLVPFAVLVFCLPAGAAVWLAGDSPGLSEGQIVDDDLYLAGGDVHVAGEVRGDLIVAGGEILLDGEVGGDLLVAGGTVRVAGPVRGTIRAAAGRLRIDAPVGEDLVVAAGEVEVGNGARIGRDLVANAGRLELLGPVARRAVVSAGTARIDADVGSDLDAQVGSLSIGPVRIGGNLIVPEGAQAEIAADATVEGKIVRPPAEKHEERGRGFFALLFLLARLLIGMWALGALFTLAAPRWSDRASSVLLERPGAAVLAGALLLVGLPLLAALVFGLGLLLGGWWIGLFVLALWGMALFLAVPITARAIGGWIAARLGGRSWPWPLALLVGLVVLVLLFAIPVLGLLVGLVVVLFGLGGLGLSRLHARSPAGPAA